MDESSGVISTLIKFDREVLTTDTVELQVIAEDGYPSSIPGKTGPNTGIKASSTVFGNSNESKLARSSFPLLINCSLAVNTRQYSML